MSIVYKAISVPKGVWGKEKVKKMNESSIGKQMCSNIEHLYLRQVAGGVVQVGQNQPRQADATEIKVISRQYVYDVYDLSTSSPWQSERPVIVPAWLWEHQTIAPPALPT